MLLKSNGSRKSLLAKAWRRTGTATVELAVLAPLLVTLVLGTVEITRAIQVKTYLTDTARSGCRLGIQPGKTTKNVTDNINTILTANGIDSSYATVTVLVNGKSVDVSTGVRGDQVSVRIGVPIAKVNWVTPLFMSNTAVESETLIMMHQ